MSIFGELGDAFFGGAEKKAGKEERKGLDQAGRDLRNATATARGEAQTLFGSGLQNTNQGFQSALDLWNQIGQRQDVAVRRGNEYAQQQMLEGLKQAHGNILGMPMDYSGLAAPENRVNFQLGQTMPTPLNPVTDLVDPSGQSYELANLPFEANNVVSMLDQGRISYQEAIDYLTTGKGYSRFSGLPKSLVDQLVAPYIPGGPKYHEGIDLNLLDRKAYDGATQAANKTKNWGK